MCSANLPLRGLERVAMLRLLALVHAAAALGTNRTRHVTVWGNETGALLRHVPWLRAKAGATAVVTENACAHRYY